MTHYHNDTHEYSPHHYGWNAVPRSLEKFLESADETNTQPYSYEAIELPSSTLSKQAIEYARNELPKPTFNHSMRVFYWGMALLKNHGPSGLKESSGLAESFLLSCMLHDIGTSPKYIRTSRMSFELWGAIKAREVLASFVAHPDQTDLVAEVINRHQDVGETGMVPAVLGLIYFGTLLDNIGANASFVHKTTIEGIIEAFPRLGWTGCFASTIRKEIGAKPWAHTTVIDRFAEEVEENKVMRPYD